MVYRFNEKWVAGLGMAALGFVPSASLGAAQGVSYEKQVKPILIEYCYDCHGDGSDKGGVVLDEQTSYQELVANVSLWEAVMNNVRAHIMPPSKKSQPTHEQREQVVRWVEQEVFRVDCNNPDPGRVTIRRLNRTEYNNTIRDLVGVDFEPAENFPEDDAGYGFDNIGDVLSISTLHLEKYLDAAQEILDRALVTEPPAPKRERIAVTKWQGGSPRHDGKILVSSGEIAFEHEFPGPGKYRIHIEAWGDQAGNEPAKMGFLLDGTQQAALVVKEKSHSPGRFQQTIQVDGGKHRIAASFLNDYYQRSGPKELRGDRNLIVTKFEVEGPLDAPPPPLPATHTRIFFKPHTPENKDARAREFVEAFATRAYRRPVQRTELNNLMTLYFMGQNDGLNFEQSVQLSLQAALVSPNFLFRGELQPEPDNPKVHYYIREDALASRLSYFLWSTMPDSELFEQARRGELRRNLEGQVKRMLQDSRGRALAENFAAQWLQTRNLDIVTVSKEHFPDYDENLKQAMRQETEEFFRYIQREDRSILDFLNGDYTFVNGRLAKHYGFEGVSGDKFQKVSLKGTQRRGVMTHASVLTITSNPTRTSPVKRGLWVLENLLGTPPPAAPGGVPALDESEEAASTGTLRERFEAHRDQPLCRSCHERMDPLGFGLENFDAVGRFRTKDGKFPVDASGELVSGETWKQPTELFEILSQQKKDDFVRCVIERMLTYALGRGVEHYDVCVINDIQERLEKNDYRFSELVMGIIESAPFQKRRGEAQSVASR